VKLNAYVSRDSKANVYNKPFFLGTHAEAIRAFHQAVKKEGTLLSEHPEDFSLYFIGSYDDNSAELEAVPPVHLANATDAIVTQQLIK